jgi:uncharacterized protein (DUF58 family)
MLTSTGRRLLLAAALLYLASWGFGTPAMFPVAVGLGLAPAAAWTWVRLLSRPARLRRTLERHELVEGASVRIGLEVRTDAGRLPPTARLVDNLGEHPLKARLLRRGHVLRGAHVINSAPRGRYRLHDAQLEFSDPFGLASARVAVPREDVLLVYPRVSPLEGMFTDGSGVAGGAARMLLHRTAGYDVHSIRDHQHGESLRRVHWRSTAKRRRLMVKELTDTPRDEVCVLLDADARCETGPVGDTSFDVQVRAAASVLAKLVEVGQRCALAINGRSRATQVRLGRGGDWHAALGELALARADGVRSLAAALGDPSTVGSLLDAARIIVVTAGMSSGLAERMLQLRSAQRDFAVVWVDAATFARGARVNDAEAAALRLSNAGVPIARIRAGDDLTTALSAATLRVPAHG